MSQKGMRTLWTWRWRYWVGLSHSKMHWLSLLPLKIWTEKICTDVEGMIIYILYSLWSSDIDTDRGHNKDTVNNLRKWKYLNVLTCGLVSYSFVYFQLRDVTFVYTFWTRCTAYVRARKQLSIHEAPNILTIVLKRFQVNHRSCKFILYFSIFFIFQVVVHIGIYSLVDDGVKVIGMNCF
jgi:hypothetical protein